MSILVSARRFGGPPQWATLRGLLVDLGLNHWGVLSESSIVKPLISFRSSGFGYLAQAMADGWTWQGDKLTKDQTVELLEPAQADFDDYKIIFIPINAEAERRTFTRLARNRSDAEEWGYLRYSIAGAYSEVKLITADELELGSDPQSELYLPLPQIELRHCKVKMEKESVCLAPLGGALSVDGAKVKGPASFKLPARVSLEPLGLEIELEGSSTCSS